MAASRFNPQQEDIMGRTRSQQSAWHQFSGFFRDGHRPGHGAWPEQGSWRTTDTTHDKPACDLNKAARRVRDSHAFDFVFRCSCSTCSMILLTLLMILLTLFDDFNDFC